MTFIRVQNAKKDELGRMVGGSASIVESVYVKDGKSPCKQVLKESLGRIVLMEDRHRGIFLSKTRGLVEYDCENDEFVPVSRDDPRISDMDVFSEPRIHTIFGDVDAVLNFMRSIGMLRTLRNVAVKDDGLYEKMVCHTLHGVLRDGARMCCDRFVERSFLSNIVQLPPSVLRTDSRYFEYMGIYETKIAFFKAFVEDMRLRVPGFGRGCYVDSTPLPNAVSDLPSNRMCSHGTDCVSMQTRLVLVLDIKTGLPVWFDLVPGNVLDLSTIMSVTERVSKTLGIRIEDMVLDAGYVCKDVIKAYNRDDNSDKTLIARMPNKNGYNMDDLFDGCRNLFGKARYAFVRQGHTYFGVKREVEIFGKREFAYVYVDQENASSCFQDYMQKHGGDFQSLSLRDKDMARYRGGFFVLLSNVDSSPDRLLDLYYGRTEIETVFMVGKNYLDMLPLNKQKDETIRGKILQDIIDIIVYLQIRKRVSGTGRSVSDLIYDLQSVYAYRDGKDAVIVEYVNKQARQAYELFDLKPPARRSITEYRNSMYLSTV